MKKIDREKKTVRMMIELYCRHHLHQKSLSPDYQQLADYAWQRLDHCHFGENKPVCKACPIHCYAPKEREAIRKVMRWTGPRMMIFAPKAAFIHTFLMLKSKINKCENK